MRVIRPFVLAGAVAIAGLAWPTGALADHVSVTASVSATVERSGTDSWAVKVSFTVQCHGTGAKGASYQGNLYLVDKETGKTIYLGGVSGASGEVTQLVHSIGRWQELGALLKVSCLDNDTLHGSGSIEAGGGSAFIPPRQAGPGGGGGGAGGGGADDSGGPTEPLRTEGCQVLLVGTEKADDLLGGADGDVVFGLAGDDRIRGGLDHDCLIGEAGADMLRGEGGWDRLTGGRGRDRLFGGPGLNSYDAGAGRDFVDAANGSSELVRCGSGRDRAKVDHSDLVRSCEVVRLP